MTTLPDRLEEAEAGRAIEELKPLLSPSGHDAYCHVCWEPTYLFWCSKESPDYTRCGVGDYTAQTCPNALATAKQKAAIQRLKDAGLWSGSLGASLAREAQSAPAMKGEG